MSVQVQALADLIIANTAALQDGFRSADPPTTTVTSSQFDEGGGRQFELANGASNLTVELGDVTTGEVFYLRSNQSVTYRLNGSTLDIPLTIDVTLSYAFALFFGTAITALTMSNASGSTATIRFGIAGT